MVNFLCRGLETSLAGTRNPGSISNQDGGCFDSACVFLLTVFSKKKWQMKFQLQLVYFVNWQRDYAVLHWIIAIHLFFLRPKTVQLRVRLQHQHELKRIFQARHLLPHFLQALPEATANYKHYFHIILLQLLGQ